MNYQTNGRNQRPNFHIHNHKLKQTVKFALLLAILIWFMYQIKDWRENDGESSLHYQMLMFGRKENAGGLRDGGVSDGGGGNDELNKTGEEKEGGNFSDLNNNDHEEEKVEKVRTRQFEESSSDEVNYSDVEYRDRNEELIRDFDISKSENLREEHDEQIDEKDRQTQDKESQNNEEEDITIGVSYNEKDEEEEASKIEENVEVKPIIMENAIFHEHSEIANEALGFTDRNGFPEESFAGLKGTDLSNDDQRNILHQEAISGGIKQSRIMESMPVEIEELAIKGGGAKFSDGEPEYRSNLEYTKNETTNDAEVNSEPSIRSDKSNARRASETTDKGRKSYYSESISSENEHDNMEPAASEIGALEHEPKWQGKACAKLEGIKPEQVWPHLEDFFSLNKWFPTLTTCLPVEGVSGQPGCVRYCAGFKTPVDNRSRNKEEVGEEKVNWTKQKLLSIDPVGMSFSYSIIDGNVGFHSYVSYVKVVPMEDDGGCNIEWSYEVEPVEGWRLEDLDLFIGSGLQVMAQRMKEALKAT